ncbi:hypothetical protein U9M48_022239 [Paspalum notatum var. saurae]|uniref:Secreted protein n=1 Tax=Paspalum notatum var. saurae TaxID=547442 RepID=A0AAQ3THW6_PASNO
MRQGTPVCAAGVVLMAATLNPVTPTGPDEQPQTLLLILLEHAGGGRGDNAYKLRTSSRITALVVRGGSVGEPFLSLPLLAMSWGTPAQICEGQ